jgi:hypothetical protein
MRRERCLTGSLCGSEDVRACPAKHITGEGGVLLSACRRARNRARSCAHGGPNERSTTGMWWAMCEA